MHLIWNLDTLHKLNPLPHTFWPVSRNKGPLNITHSVDPDQPLYCVENTLTQSNCLLIKKYKCFFVTSVKRWSSWRRDATVVLGLHFLHRSEGPFSHDVGHMIIDTIRKNEHTLGFGGESPKSVWKENWVAYVSVR